MTDPMSEVLRRSNVGRILASLMLNHPNDEVDIEDDAAAQNVRFIVTSRTGAKKYRDIPYSTLSSTELSDDTVQILLLVGWVKPQIN